MLVKSENPKTTIIIGDSRRMEELKDESVHLIITSPPVKKVKEQSRLTEEEWNQYFTGHWNFPGEKQDRYLAMFLESRGITV